MKWDFFLSFFGRCRWLKQNWNETTVDSTQENIIKQTRRRRKYSLVIFFCALKKKMRARTQIHAATMDNLVRSNAFSATPTWIHLAALKYTAKAWAIHKCFHFRDDWTQTFNVNGEPNNCRRKTSELAPEETFPRRIINFVFTKLISSRWIRMFVFASFFVDRGKIMCRMF